MASICEVREHSKMMRTTFLLAVAAAMVSGCHSASTIVTPAQCPAWQNIDFSGLPTHLNDDPHDPLLENIWADWANTESGVVWGAGSPTSAVHFITSPGGLTTDPTVREIIGRQSPAGWEIYARSTPSNPAERPHWTDWRRVRLSSNGERKLTAILRDPCFWAAPRFLEGEVHLLNGRGDARPDGPSTGYDVTHGDRRWGGWHFSWSVGPQGQLRSLLLAEAFGLPEWVDDDIGPDGWFDWPSR
jgi:hypothetical protein